MQTWRAITGFDTRLHSLPWKHGQGAVVATRAPTAQHPPGGRKTATKNGSDRVVDNQHRQIDGYRDLSQEEIDLINMIKTMERQSAELWRQVTNRTDTDQRWAAIGRTHLEEGFSAIIRSVAKPDSSF